MINDPLFHPGWIKFNCDYWNLTAETIELKSEKEKVWGLKTIIYKNKKGEIITPPRNPYLPITFSSSSAAAISYNRRRKAAYEALATVYDQSSCKGNLILSSSVNDIRAFTWAGFSAAPLYTYYLDIQNYKKKADTRVLKHARKAEDKGYYIERTQDFDLVQKCLTASEKRKGFSHAIDAEGLKLLNEYMSPDYLHCYIAKNSMHEAVGARVLIVDGGNKVLAWSAGIDSSVLKDGVNHFMVEKLLDHYAKEGYEIFDFVGANIPPVAAMKEAWGGKLVVYYTLRQNSLRNLIINGYRFFKKLKV
ncbi:GNAT family N-acetyltransferase [Acinetobacter indicus]|uniref:GNAT family N-acetyltransferase n=1 Tax=Acinetobacter indicus TaxID=756892 RepID=UPI0013150E83|nr:GNAT family N-acetyltransferase [Acinetobacter indicus]